MDKKINTPLDISIVVINFNSHKLISDMLKSFYEFSEGFSYELIIVDNGSGDGSLEQIKQEFPDLIYIDNKKNLGFAAANNRGLEIAKGRYTLFLNNDTLFIENSIKKIIDFSDSSDSEKMIGCRLLNEDMSLQHSVVDFPSLWKTFCANFFLYRLFPRSKYFNKYHFMNNKINTVTKVEVVIGAFIFAKTSCLKELGGFDESFFFYGEDSDLCYRFNQKIGDVIYFPETSIVHIKGSSANKNLWFKHKNRSIAMIKIFQKHFRGLKFPTALFIHYLGIFIRIPILYIAGLLLMKKSWLEQGRDFLKLLVLYPQNIYKN